MGRKHVEYFRETNPAWLEAKINDWAEDHGCEPISISVIRDGIVYMAFVVMEEKDDGK